MSGLFLSRRGLLALGAAAVGTLAAPAVLRADEPEQERVRRNIMSFRTHNWRDHFSNLRRGAILCDLESRAVHFWSQDESVYRLYPSSVPMSDEFARRGVTEIVALRRDPTWIPTPGMRERNPSLPAVVPPGPNNPLGTRAMNLGWQYYRIHGIDDTRKIGRMASNGCVGLFNHHVEELFEMVRIGTQVRMI